MRLRGCLFVLIIGIAAVSRSTFAFEIEILGGSTYGPGPMPETPHPPGRISNIILDEYLNGKTAYFNNGPELPNVPYEGGVFEKMQGLLSDGSTFNESYYGGVVSIGQGAMSMLSLAAGEGPTQGEIRYELDDRLNWHLTMDLALDPGFIEGLIVTESIDISTGVIWLRHSEQTERELEGGYDFADSLPSGAPAFGRIGDFDNDGFLDGEQVGSGRIPLSFTVVPGAPVFQRWYFKSDIPISRQKSAILEFAGLANLADILRPLYEDKTQENVDLTAWYAESLTEIATGFSDRAEFSVEKLKSLDAAETEQATALSTVLKNSISLAKTPHEYVEAVLPSLQKLEKTLPNLVLAFREE